MKKYLIVGMLMVGCSGPAGQPGTNGSNGMDGNQGPIGVTGVTGTAAINPVVVQFCQGTTSYPNTFCEIAECIGNQLYAVYSQNDGFLVYLPPGTYSSNGLNCACTFTISDNCVVTQ